MTGMREELERHRHRPQPPRRSSHWAPGDKAVLHEGPVKGCPECAALRQGQDDSE